MYKLKVITLANLASATEYDNSVWMQFLSNITNRYLPGRDYLMKNALYTTHIDCILAEYGGINPPCTEYLEFETEEGALAFKLAWL